MKHDFSKTKIFQGATPEIFARARELRKNMTPAEKLLWEKLRNNQLDGFYFRRQHPIKFFIADFYCAKADLIVELDGGIHLNTDVHEHDINRTAELENLGIKVIRFTNEEVFNNIDDVIERIRKELTNTTIPNPTLTPSPSGEARRGQNPLGEVGGVKINKLCPSPK